MRNGKNRSEQFVSMFHGGRAGFEFENNLVLKLFDRESRNSFFNLSFKCLVAESFFVWLVDDFLDSQAKYHLKGICLRRWDINLLGVGIANSHFVLFVLPLVFEGHDVVWEYPVFEQEVEVQLVEFPCRVDLNGRDIFRQSSLFIIHDPFVIKKEKCFLNLYF